MFDKLRNLRSTEDFLKFSYFALQTFHKELFLLFVGTLQAHIVSNQILPGKHHSETAFMQRLKDAVKEHSFMNAIRTFYQLN